MEKQFKRSSGISLLLGSLLAILTMVMHPMGGSMEHIVKIRTVLIFSHSIAILCMPFIAFGFWGLSVRLQTKDRLSTLAFCAICFGLIAAMIAATINGLVLPTFVSKYYGAEADANYIRTILGYGNFMNIALAKIFIVAACISVTIWSWIIIQTKQLNQWLGFYGLVVVSLGLAGMILKFNFTSVAGFGFFVFGLVSWKIIAGICLLTNKGILEDK